MHEKEGEEDEVKSIDIVHEDDTYIVFQNGLRLSKPYAFDFIANVKRRWCEVEMKKRITSLISFTRSFRICRESTTRKLSKMDGYA